MWQDFERIAARQGRDVSSAARAAVIREIVRSLAGSRGARARARNYWADTEAGRHVADPSEARTAELIAGLARPGNTFVIFTPAGDDAAWYARVSLAEDHAFEVHCFGPALSEHHYSGHAEAGPAATALHAWLAHRPGTGGLAAAPGSPG